MRTATLTAALLLVVPLSADDKPGVRALDLKGVRVVESKDFGAPKPAEVKTADELAKSALFADGRDAIKKQLDFSKEKLVVFVWSGSGRDKLTPELKTVDKKVVAVFTYKVGETDDLRRHALVFAVPKGATVEVKK
jgi:hypothetical protein